MSYSVGYCGKAWHGVTNPSRTHRRSSGPTRSGSLFVLLLTLSSVAVALAVYFALRGPAEALQESPAEAGAAISTPSPAASDTIEVQPAVVLPPLPTGPNTAWQPLDIDSVEPERIPEYKEIVEGRVLVELSTGMWSWGVGDRITLAVPQIGAVYEPVIDRVETALGNNRSYVGRLIEAEFPYSFVITVGQRNTFANLSTPQGSFELVGGTQLAWLMPVANMDRHVDYSQPDYYIPGDEIPDAFNPGDEIPDAINPGDDIPDAINPGDDVADDR